MPRLIVPRPRQPRSWRERHRQYAEHAAKIATAHLAQSGRIVRPRVSKRTRPAA